MIATFGGNFVIHHKYCTVNGMKDTTSTLNSGGITSPKDIIKPLMRAQDNKETTRRRPDQNNVI